MPYIELWSIMLSVSCENSFRTYLNSRLIFSKWTLHSEKRGHPFCYLNLPSYYTCICVRLIIDIYSNRQVMPLLLSLAFLGSSKVNDYGQILRKTWRVLVWVSHSICVLNAMTFWFVYLTHNSPAQILPPPLDWKTCGLCLVGKTKIRLVTT